MGGLAEYALTKGGDLREQTTAEENHNDYEYQRNDNKRSLEE